jgi:ketosteroid isomerase-like protein
MRELKSIERGGARGARSHSQVTGAHADALRQAYECFNAHGGRDFDPQRDAPELWELLAEDIEVHEPDDLPEPRVFVGREGYRAATREATEGYENLRYQLRWILEVGDHLLVVVRGAGRERESGAGRELREVHLWTLRGGKFARVQGFHTADDALRAAERMHSR